MIEFLRRDPSAVPLPSPGAVRPFADLEGNLCLLDEHGQVRVLAHVGPVAVDDAGTASERLGGVIDGATIGAKNRVSRTGPAMADAPGFRGLPSNPRTGAYVLAQSDAGICVPNTAGGWVIPDNADVPFPVDTAIVLRNDSDSPQDLTIGADTLRWAGTAETGDRVLAERGVATLCKTGPTEWLCWGMLS